MAEVATGGAAVNGAVLSGMPRRALLGRAGAVLGAGVAGTVAAGALAGDALPAAMAELPKNLDLDAVRLRILGTATRLTIGAARTVRGTLRRAGGQREVGEFFAHGIALAEPSMFGEGPLFYETHLFTIGDATLTGTGLVDHAGSGIFTITGGTGRFAGARGSYASRHAADHSGSGEGRFTFTIG